MTENINLPIDFVKRMEQDLGSDFHAFLQSYNEDKVSALRFNPLKADGKAIEKIKACLKGRVSWSRYGYYYDEAEFRAGLHPYHAAGSFYIQDASAQLPVEMLEPKPGDICLDLCAAPGGKSTQIAGFLMGSGLLVSNEPVKSRARVLSENVERLGIRNGIVTSEYPDRLSEKFPLYFDKIMVDAPCSGEGMFRKNLSTRQEWSLDNVRMCAARQRGILDEAYKMLKPGGRLCYSTCTFSREENEDVRDYFLKSYADISLISEKRLWPHMDKCEGHYVCLFEKAGEYTLNERNAKAVKSPDKKLLKDYFDFIDKTMTDIKVWHDNLYMVEDRLYKLPDCSVDFRGIHVLRGGLFLGTLKKNRFEPGHALALALKADEVVSLYDMPSDGEKVTGYLSGLSLAADAGDGWVLMTVDGYSLGWGKAVNGQIKNHYPKGLRRV